MPTYLYTLNKFNHPTSKISSNLDLFTFAPAPALLFQCLPLQVETRNKEDLFISFSTTTYYNISRQFLTNTNASHCCFGGCVQLH